MISKQAGSEIPLNLPAVFLAFWRDEKQTSSEDLAAALAELIQLPGVHQTGPHTLAVLPIAGDPAEIELAINLARRLRRTAQVGVLIFPGDVRVNLERVEAAEERLFPQLQKQQPALAADRVYLTGYAVSRLRGEWPLESCDTQFGGVRIFSLRGSGFNFRPWHNPRLLLRMTEHAPRPEVEQALRSHADAPLLRVQGAVGCGKSRLVWQTLGPQQGTDLPARPRTEARPVWVSLLPPRYGAMSFGLLVLRRLARVTGQAFAGEGPIKGLDRLRISVHSPWLLGTDPEPDENKVVELVLSALATARELFGAPMRLVFDDLPQAGPVQRDQLARLLEQILDHQLGSCVLINRLGHPWPAGLDASPLVPVPVMTSDQLEELSHELFQGLALPLAVQGRLREACGGLPLALEEGLIKMIHGRHLRQIYGSFFFNGSPDLSYEPSARWIQLLESEARSLGGTDGLRILAACGIALPVSELSSATSLLGVKLQPRWEEPFQEAGWLQRQNSEWGPGIAFQNTALRGAMAATLEGSVLPMVRNTMGELLSHASDRPQARWQAYNLLSGTEAAVPPILELAKDMATAGEAERVLEGLKRELLAHRKRGGDSVTEIQLLWTLLPLARKVGRLEEYEDELERALKVSAQQPRKLLAFASLKTELDLQKGRFKEGEKTLRSALEVVVDEDPGRQALLLLQLCRLLARQSRHDEARALLKQLLPVLEKRKARAQIASCKFMLGNIASHEDQLEEARRLHLEALEERRREGSLKSLGASLSALGGVALAQGNYGEALSFYNEAEAVLEEHGEVGEVSFALLGRGRVLRRLGDYASASRDLRMAIDLRGETADRVGEALPRLALAANYLDLAKTSEALTEARLASFDLRLGSESSQLGDAEQLLGRIHLQMRQYDKAQSHLQTALEVHRRQSDANGAVLDLTAQLRLAMARKEGLEILRLCGEIEAERLALKPSERREILDFWLFEGYRWLDENSIPHGSRAVDFLHKAYAELMRKAELLDAELRHRYLFQVPENAAMLEAAASHHLGVPV
jgi:tetratricopeptide (TPR) repeat protein